MEAYFFAFAEAAEPAAAVQAVLQAGGARAEWLSEVHWLGDDLPRLPVSCPVFIWPPVPLAALFQLQALARTLQAGASTLAILGQNGSDGALAVLMGAPAVVGRWNLPPLGRVTPFPAGGPSQESYLTALVRQVGQTLPEETRIAFVGVQGLNEERLPEGFAGAALVPGEADLTLAARLMRALQESRAAAALLAGFTGRGGLAVLIERI
ncbi:MAG TPA: hypothetical protein DEQ80_01520 [Anaerolinea thermolimosa]|uniref:Uncharacterized protein n=1 Tax=Anaerolinea thermolimosa TaxID=229919 RepID=A0A3D1JE82_9CHLR|nr:hypothetical protein [Anaerolinea thermolimosa]GAP08202.1 hypothetical protein ATHL_03103 [Anaerolinea thermolimosa]HCE16515.1 hypothetical protein [Anaerolinea thermolimosa]